MCEIIGKTKIEDFTVIDCTPYDKPYNRATVMKIFNSDDSVFETSDFGFEKFTECFSAKKTLSIVTKVFIPEKFLKKGNKIELL